MNRNVSIFLGFYFMLSSNCMSQIIHLNFEQWPMHEISIAGFYGSNLIPITSVPTDTAGVLTMDSEELAFTPGFVRFQIEPNNYIDLIISGEENVFITFPEKDITANIQVYDSSENLLMLSLSEINRNTSELIHPIAVEQSYLDRTSEQYAWLDLKRDTILSEANANIYELCKSNATSYFALTTVGLVTPSPVRYDRDYIADHYFDNIDFSNPAILNSTLLPNQYMKYFEGQVDYNEEGFKKAVDYILNESSENSQVFSYSLEFLMELFGNVGPELIFEYLVQEYYLNNSCAGDNFNATVNDKVLGYEMLQVGMKVPPIVLYSISKSQNLDSLVACNELSILFYWASYCHFCESEIPQLINLSSSFPEQLQVIAISLDTDKQDWQDSQITTESNWINICDTLGWDSPNVASFLVNKTPTLFLFNKEGIILAKSSNVDVIDRLVSQFLK